MYNQTIKQLNKIIMDFLIFIFIILIVFINTIVAGYNFTQEPENKIKPRLVEVISILTGAGVVLYFGSILLMIGGLMASSR